MSEDIADQSYRHAGTEQASFSKSGKTLINFMPCILYEFIKFYERFRLASCLGFT